MRIFSGSSSQKLGEGLAKALNEKLFLPEKFVFPDGEERIRILEKVLDEDVVIVESLSPPVNENLIELCFITDGVKRSGGKRVTAVIPYLGYQRQDRVFREGEAVSLHVVIKILEAVGVDRIITFDLHSIKIPELFHIPVLHLSAIPLFAKTIKKMRLPKKSVVLISPDMGGVRRVKLLLEQLDGVATASIVKDRDLVTGAVTAKKFSSASNITELKNKTAIIVDDMISGGGTIIKAVELLKEHGVAKIVVFATHPLFSQNAATLLQDAPIDRVYVTDTIFVPKKKRFAKLEILSIADMVAQNLKTV